MAWPIISSTITTLMVFMPLLFWPGIVGQFMQYLPMTVIAVLTASLLMALIFIPVLGGLIGKRHGGQIAVSATAPHFYRAVLKFAVRRPAIVMISVIGFMGVSFFGYASAKSQFEDRTGLQSPSLGIRHFFSSFKALV